MQAVVGGDRCGPFIVFRDEDGLRHAVRLASVLAVSDADCDQAATVFQLPGGRSIIVHASLDEALSWFT